MVIGHISVLSPLKLLFMKNQYMSIPVGIFITIHYYINFALSPFLLPFFILAVSIYYFLLQLWGFPPSSAFRSL